MIATLVMLLAWQEPLATTQEAVPLAEAVAASSDAQELRIHRQRRIDGFSEAGDAAGHTGEVIVEVIVQPDGSMGPVTVVESSRSELLDAEAIRLIATARITARSEPMRYHIPVEFLPSGILDMKCDEFTRQVRWHQSVWPEAEPKAMKIYTMSVGAMTAIAPNTSVDAMLGPVRRMDGAWPGIIADCERQPDAVYLRVLNARIHAGR